jgi:hypothetical protein
VHREVGEHVDGSRSGWCSPAVDVGAQPVDQLVGGSSAEPAGLAVEHGVEAEPGFGHGDERGSERDLGRGDDMTDDVAHGPSVTQRCSVPLLGRERLELVGKLPAPRGDHLPGLHRASLLSDVEASAGSRVALA